MTRPFATLIALALASCAHAGTDEPSPPHQSSIGYISVAEALTDLTSHPGNVVSAEQGWTIINHGESFTLWSFTPEGHPAHPAAVRRTTVERDGVVYIEMDALCQASKPACDELIEQFKGLNENIRGQFRNAP